MKIYVAQGCRLPRLSAALPARRGDVFADLSGMWSAAEAGRWLREPDGLPAATPPGHATPDARGDGRRVAGSGTRRGAINRSRALANEAIGWSEPI